MLGHYYEWIIMEGGWWTPPDWPALPAHNLCLLGAQFQCVHFSQPGSHWAGLVFKDSGATNLALSGCRSGQTVATQISIGVSDKSDEAECCHTIADTVSTSQMRSVRVLPPPCSCVTGPLVRQVRTDCQLCVHFNAHLFPHSCIKLYFIKSMNTIFREVIRFY